MDYNFSNTKRKKFKKWLLGGNSKIYLIILLITLVAVLFALYSLKTIEPAPEKESETYTADKETQFILESDKYTINVNKSNNFVTVLKLNENNEYSAVKTFRCSVNSSVPTGKISISDKQTWLQFDTYVYGRFVSILSNNIFIHSVPYTAQDALKLNADAYNKLGNKASIGSIYLQVSDAKWIYENCGKNTIVTIYEKSDEKPAIELGDFKQISSQAKYDPSDEEIAKNASPNKIGGMTGITNISLKVNERFDKWEGVNAIDVTNKDITSLITISGNIDTTKPGNYVLSYQLVDVYGNVLVKKRYITVYQ